jgi:hypothetical protein
MRILHKTRIARIMEEIFDKEGIPEDMRHRLVGVTPHSTLSVAALPYDSKLASYRKGMVNAIKRYSAGVIGRTQAKRIEKRLRKVLDEMSINDFREMVEESRSEILKYNFHGRVQPMRVLLKEGGVRTRASYI